MDFPHDDNSLLFSVIVIKLATGIWYKEEITKQWKFNGELSEFPVKLEKFHIREK